MIHSRRGSWLLDPVFHVCAGSFCVLTPWLARHRTWTRAHSRQCLHFTMPSADDLKSYQRLQAGGAAIPALVSKPTPLPVDVVKRFPSLADWQKRETKRTEAMNTVLQRLNGVV